MAYTGKRSDLVVETPSSIEEVEEIGVGRSSPEIHVRDLKVAPDCNVGR
jgi:hypothetical protein